MADPVPEYSTEKLATDDVSKKDLVAALQKHAATQVNSSSKSTVYFQTV